MVNCPAVADCHTRVYVICYGWQLHIVHSDDSVIDEDGFLFLPLALCTVDISSPPSCNDSVSLAYPHVSRMPDGTLHNQEDESWFSNLAIGKPYYQHNAGVKDDGGAVGLTECPLPCRRGCSRTRDVTCHF